MSSNDLNVSVVVEETIGDQALDEIRAVLDDAGVSARLEPSLDDIHGEYASWSDSRRKAFRTDTAGMFRHTPAWALYIYAPANQFVSSLGARTTKNLVEDIWALRTRQSGAKGNDGLVMLVDEETGIRATLERDLPDDAYDILSSVDFRAFHADPLHFFRDRGRHGRWRSPDNVTGTG